MSDATDAETVEILLTDPFHSGLEEHGEFTGFSPDRRREDGPTNAMSDEEISDAKSRIERLFSRRGCLLVAGYLITMGLLVLTYQ